MTIYIHKIQFYETDAMGVVHHSNYICFFEKRVYFMNKVGFGYEKSVEAGIDIPVLAVNCEYKSMVNGGLSLLL